MAEAEMTVLRTHLFWIVLFVTLGCTGSSFAASVTELRDGVQWGWTKDQVVDHYKVDLVDDYRKKTKGSRDIVYNDRLRKAVDEKVKAFASTYVEFDGARTGYESSAIALEVYAGANLSMLIQKDADNPQYYVFKNGKLAKILVAMNVAGLQFIPFHAFIDTLIDSYGKTKTRESKQDDIGVEHDVRATWVQGDTRMRAENRDAVFNTYLLVLTPSSKDDFMANANIQTRATDSAGSDLDDIFAQAESESANVNHKNVVDRLTESTSDVTIRLRSDAKAGEALTSSATGSSAMDDTEVLEDVEKKNRKGSTKKSSSSSKPSQKSQPKKSKGGGRTIY